MSLGSVLWLTNQSRERAGLHPKRKRTYWGGKRSTKITNLTLFIRTIVSGYRKVKSDKANMRLRSQKTLTPRPETPRNSRRPSNKATPRPTRLNLSATESPIPAKVNLPVPATLTRQKSCGAATAFKPRRLLLYSVVLVTFSSFNSLGFCS